VTVDSNAPLLELARAFSSKTFAEKYPSRNRGVVVLAMVLLTLAVVEKFLETVRAAVFVLWQKHDRHTVLSAFDRTAPAGGHRIIIALA
jgi:hypothetical protein